MPTAVLVLSQAGLDLARRLRAASPGQTWIFGPACVVGRCAAGGADEQSPDPALPPGCFAADEEGVCGWRGPLRKFFPEVWTRFEAIVCVMAAGIVVRLTAPLLADKRRDPAVVVIDEGGRFAISLLGGHEAGANDLARALATLLGAQAVVTTASEAHGLPAVDLVGKAWGWTIERRENLTRVAAAVVRREVIGVWQDAGTRDWWRPFGPWPATFMRLESLAAWQSLQPAALLVISDLALPANLPPDAMLVYRPRSLVAGIGCRRGVGAEALGTFLDQVLQEHALAPASLGALATVTLKADEPGLRLLASRRGLPLLIFTPEELSTQAGIERPSERVRAKIGIAAVAEPAALRAAEARRLLVPKQIGPGITVAIARQQSRGSSDYHA